MSQPGVVPCLQGESTTRKERSCESSSRERLGRWDGTSFPGWSRQVTRSPPPRGRPARSRSCVRRARSRWSSLYDAEGRVVSVVELDVAGGVVQALRAVVNPDKLGHIGPVSDLARLPEK